MMNRPDIHGAPGSEDPSLWDLVSRCFPKLLELDDRLMLSRAVDFVETFFFETSSFLELSLTVFCDVESSDRPRWVEEDVSIPRPRG
jgi:hypothetical protein